MEKINTGASNTNDAELGKAKRVSRDSEILMNQELAGYDKEQSSIFDSFEDCLNEFFETVADAIRGIIDVFQGDEDRDNDILDNNNEIASGRKQSDPSENGGDYPAEEDMTVSKGQLTFDAEGNDNAPSMYFSRILHVPSDNSGVTLGRGYDMKQKSPEKIKSDLMDTGIDAETAEKLSRASGKSGNDAKKFIDDNGLADFTITPEQQKVLFSKVYEEAEADVKRICAKADTVQAYGEVDWESLNPKIKDMLVDLRFRGDYTPASRRIIQQYVVNNDYEGFCEAMTNAGNWKNVPADRFQRRIDYLAS